LRVGEGQEDVGHRGKAGRREKPVPLDLEAEKVHSTSIFHFHDEKLAVELPLVVKG
jgi:hypothetical protein